MATVSIPLFQSARTLYGLTSGIEPLDSFLGPLKEGWVTCFSGSKLCYDLLTRYAVNAQLIYRKKRRTQEEEEEEGGGKHPLVIFIDGGNSFDAYGVAKYARMQRIDPRKALENILLSRAFTPYQLATLIIDEVPRAIDEHKARVILVSDITALFSLDEDGIDEKEARIVFSKVKRCLNWITKEKEAISICSSIRSKKFLDEALRSSPSFFDVLVKIEDLQNKFRAKILEYPKGGEDGLEDEEEWSGYKRRGRLGFADSCDFNLATKTEEERVKRLAMPVIKYATSP